MGSQHNETISNEHLVDIPKIALIDFQHFGTPTAGIRDANICDQMLGLLNSNCWNGLTWSSWRKKQHHKPLHLKHWKESDNYGFKGISLELTVINGTSTCAFSFEHNISLNSWKSDVIAACAHRTVPTTKANTKLELAHIFDYIFVCSGPYSQLIREFIATLSTDGENDYSNNAIDAGG